MIIKLEIGPESPFDHKDVISSVIKQVDNSQDVDFSTINEDSISHSKDRNESSFFFLDAEEPDIKAFELPGVVLLFGKLRFYKDNHQPFDKKPIDCSCCCVVQDIPRIVYLLPKNPYSSDNFVTCYEEFNRIANTLHILEFSSRIVKKSVCFTFHDIPSGSDFLEIRYSRQYPNIPNDLVCDSFFCFSNTTENVLETLLVHNGIKGPCWLSLFDFTILSSNTFSCCKITLSLRGLHNIVVQSFQPSPPKFLALSLCIKYIESNIPESNKEIVILAYCIDKNRQIEDATLNDSFGPYIINICDIYKDPALAQKENMNIDTVGKDITILFHEDENSLLMHFSDQLYSLNPDFIFGYDTNFWLDLISARLQVHHIRKFSFIEKLKRKTYKFSRKTFHTTISFGRVVFDLCHSSKEFIKLDYYDIPSITSFVFNRRHYTLNHTQVKDIFLDSTDRLRDLVENVITESELILLLENELNIIKLAYQLTILAGNILSRTLLGGRAERNDFLLLHAFHARNYILPQKHTLIAPENNSEFLNKVDSHKKKSTFSGGLVFEPKKGLYNTFTLVLDFNSLYPSLIQEYNICFSTIDINSTEDPCLPPGNSKNLGVIPQELQLLVKKRKELKLQMKNFSLNSYEYSKLNICQKALKLTANSIYGCLGYSHSRFFARSLASLVTSLGREVLSSTKFFVENQFGLEVIYGDTDSIMIDTKLTNINQVKSLGNQLKTKINDIHNLLEIDIDSIYRRLLLLRKKKYAALSVNLSTDGIYTEIIDLKGLDIIRRDWCCITKKCGRFVIETILNNNHDTLVQKLRDYLSAFSDRIRNDLSDIDEFIIYKTLNKLPEEYADCNAYPHVAVAKWLKNNGGITAIGHVIPYVICNDGTNSNPLRRAYHPDRLRKSLAAYDSQLYIDKEYYLSNQIFPVISRLCAPLIDSKVISEFLGLHSVSLAKECVLSEKQRKGTSDAELSLTCPHCKIQFFCLLPTVSNSVISCTNCLLEICYQNLLFGIVLNFREHIKMLYFREQKCTEFFCSFITKDLNFINNIDSPCSLCFKCNQGIMKSMLPTFSISKKLNSLGTFYSSFPSLLQNSYNIFLTHSSFNTVCLLDLF
ncbi:DNA polymerase alpha catalytic subunit [Oopsacas minuta]|uniref:DNA polymerase n=1 Tax=Oopsacas minuta TaxID=111878 RepID=A0AAV7KH21_9METZ|nr:DNA polymerase alpha catalytic subunit [Oopsacas minuta]